MLQKIFQKKMLFDDQILKKGDFRKFEKDWLNIPVFMIFTKVAQKNKNKIALKCGDQQLSYQETYNWAISIAKAIKAVNIDHEPIGIALPNNEFFPVAMLASLAIGCPYVPLDIDLPMARNQLIVEQSGIKSIITAKGSPVFSEGLNIIDIDTLIPFENDQLETLASPDDIAYIIYTSGSTGIPKGVYQNQRNLLHDIMQYTNAVCLCQNDRLSLLYSPGVGGAIRDIYGALLNGATLIIKNLKKTGLYDLGEFIQQERISIYHSIPNIFRTFLKLNPQENFFSSVRLIYLAGDRIYNTDVDLYKKLFTVGCVLYVGIGATEIATIYRQWFINHHTIINQELIPVGFAVDDREMYLVDEENKPVPDGETGEICVNSQYISLGYWNNPQQTKDFFTTNPDSTEIRTFRTGDLGRINSAGLLEFIGRKDNQVKINGYRVELGEIEGIIMSYPAIERCVVILTAINQHNTLLAFFVSKKEISGIMLKNWISDRLPDYMVPQRCIQLDEIPQLPNFKNDSKALKALSEKYTNVSAEKAILTPSEEKNDFLFMSLRRAWCKFLDEHSFDKNIQWKDAGGDSLNAVNFLVQLESDLGVSLPTDWVHGGMAPKEIYTFLQNLNIAEPINKQNIIYVFPALGGTLENTRAFLNDLSEYANLTIINYPTFRDTDSGKQDLSYVTEYIIQQMPHFNEPNSGFLSVCSGALIMNHILATKSLRYYSLIGIVEGRAIHQFKPIYSNFFQRALNLFKKGNFIDNCVAFLYSRSNHFKKAIHHLERERYYTMKTHYYQNIVWDLYRHLQPSYLDVSVLYFGSNNSAVNRDGEEWKPYFRETKVIQLSGSHIDMFNWPNAKTVLDKIRGVFEQQQDGSTQ